MKWLPAAFVVLQLLLVLLLTRNSFRCVGVCGGLIGLGSRGRGEGEGGDEG